MKFNEIIKLKPTKKDVLESIDKALDYYFKDNLRKRDINVKFDNNVRGFLAETMFVDWLKQNKLNISKKNTLAADQYMDIDVTCNNKHIEVKTSLVPDRFDTLENTFNQADIKLIRRGANAEIEDLKGDVHVQIYYEMRTRIRDSWLKKQDVNYNECDLNEIYESLKLERYLDHSFFFCWIDKATLVERIKDLPEHKRLWKYEQREFWRCPLKTAFPPKELPSYLLEN